MVDRGAGGRFILVMVVVVVGILFFAEALKLQTHSAEGKYQDRFKPDKEDNVSRIIDHSGGVNLEPMKAEAKDFPWQVLMQVLKTKKGVLEKKDCSGSIIYLDWIMTAAHCLSEETKDSNGISNGSYVTAKRIVVFAGITKALRVPNLQARFFSIEEIMYEGDKKLVFIHEEHNKGIEKSYDIALIKLKDPLHTSDYVKPISLATAEDNLDLPIFTVAGWGHTAFENSKVQDDLRYVTGLKLLDQTECMKHFNRMRLAGATASRFKPHRPYPSYLDHYYTADSMICFDGTDKTFFIGDSGGPITTKQVNGANSDPVQVGIVSWGKPDEYRGVATGVSMFRTWIQGITNVPLVDECPANQGDLRSADTLNINRCRYGECINGRCTCYPGYMGPSCDERETVCPEDRGFFSPAGSKQCFRLFESKVTWQQAKQTCTDHGLFLAHPWDVVGLRSYIIQRYGGDNVCWLGARKDESKTMMWEDNREEVTSDNPLWYTIDPKEVQPQSGKTGCLSLLAYHRYWKKAADQVLYDNLCNIDRKPLCEFFPAVGCNNCQHGNCFKSVCLCHDGYTGNHCSEKETVSCPATLYKSEGSDQCFKILVDEAVSWDRAVEKCKDAGLKLAEPTDAVAVTLLKDIKDRDGEKFGFAWLNARGNSNHKIMWQRGWTELRPDNSLWFRHPISDEVTTDTCVMFIAHLGIFSDQPEHPYHLHDCPEKFFPLCEYLRE